MSASIRCSGSMACWPRVRERSAASWSASWAFSVSFSQRMFLNFPPPPWSLNQRPNLSSMPELPELEPLRIRFGPRLEGRLITAATVNPKQAHMLRYPVEHFANELPARRIVSLSLRAKHLGFATELGGGGSDRWLVINPMLGGRFQLADGEVPVPATEVFDIRIEGGQELRCLQF